MIMEIISIILGIILLGTGFGYGWFDLHQLIFLLDLPSLITMLVFTVPILFKSGVWNDFKRAWRLLSRNYTCHLSELRRTLDVVEMMQKQVIYAGVICMLMTFITIMHSLSDLASLGPNLAVAILTMLYALIFEMLLLPLQMEVKRRIIDYMEVDTEEGAVAEKFEAAAGDASENTEASAGKTEDEQA